MVLRLCVLPAARSVVWVCFVSDRHGEGDDVRHCSYNDVGWFRGPGGDRLSRALRHSIIGAGGFHVRVRDGIGWGPAAMATRLSEPTLTALCVRRWGSGSGFPASSSMSGGVCCCGWVWPAAAWIAAVQGGCARGLSAGLVRGLSRSGD